MTAVAKLPEKWKRESIELCALTMSERRAYKRLADELEAALSPAELGGVEVTTEMAMRLKESLPMGCAGYLTIPNCRAALENALAYTTPRADEAVSEEVQDAVDSILSQLGGWAKAYPLDIFSEPTDEEREWLHTTKPGLMDRIAASMGRHMAKCIAEDLAALTAALTPPSAKGE